MGYAVGRGARILHGALLALQVQVAELGGMVHRHGALHAHSRALLQALLHVVIIPAEHRGCPHPLRSRRPRRPGGKTRCTEPSGAVGSPAGKLRTIALAVTAAAALGCAVAAGPAKRPSAAAAQAAAPAKRHSVHAFFDSW